MRLFYILAALFVLVGCDKIFKGESTENLSPEEAKEIIRAEEESQVSYLLGYYYHETRKGMGASVLKADAESYKLRAKADFAVSDKEAEKLISQVRSAQFEGVRERLEGRIVPLDTSLLLSARPPAKDYNEFKRRLLYSVKYGYNESFDIEGYDKNFLSPVVIEKKHFLRGLKDFLQSREPAVKAEDLKSYRWLSSSKIFVKVRPQ